ncbi:AsnC family transcriptional regulator [Candidatus Woesearchaeota archaeon]|nr:AsnC family transcriptional regulator [Candidatus Woesearchaeota archaeon]
MSQKLDKIDRKLITGLDSHPKIAISLLAKKNHLSPQVADYRIKRLQEQNIIVQFGTIFNLSKLGYQQYRVFMQLGNINEENKHHILSYLQKYPGVYWSALVGGKWDLLIVVWAKDYHALENFLEDIFTKYPHTIRDYDALYIIYQEFHSHYFLEKNNNPSLKLDFGKSAPNISLDSIDLNIIHSLKNNCRLSSLEISRSAKVNYKTIQNRILSLEKQGLISGYRLFLKSEELGYNAYLLLISFRSYDREEEKKLRGYVQENPHITQYLKIFGPWSIMLHLRVKDNQELQNIIIELREKYSLIGDYEIIPVFQDILINNFPLRNEDILIK